MAVSRFTNLSDERLIKLIAKDNELALAELFERYWGTLLDNAVKVLKDEDAAQDAVQEVFTDIWRKRYLLKVEKVEPYIYSAVRYKVISQIRKSRINFVDLDFVDLFVQSNTTEDLINSSEINDLLRTSMVQLPEKCRKVFEMSRIEQLSNKEIAEKLDISVRTVENHIAYAIRILKPVFERNLLTIFGLMMTI